jgi:hypothetical protein
MSIDVGGHPTAGPGREPLDIDARRLLDATPECLLVAATDGRVVYANVVRVMIDLAQNLRMTPLAEGIETQGEVEFLVEHGCPLGQGFHLGRLMPASQVPAFIATNR